MFDLKGKEVEKVTALRRCAAHAELHRRRQGAKTSKLNAPIAEGYNSVLLCHLANIARRTGRTIMMDTATKRIKGDAEAAKLWSARVSAGV